MIRVLHVTQKVNFGGSSRSLCAIARHLPRWGRFEQAVVSLSPTTDPARKLVADAGLSLIEAPGAEEFRRHIEEADILQLHWWNNPGIYEVLRGPLPPTRLALFIHVAGDAAPGLTTRKLIDHVDFCIAGCRYTYEHSAIAELPSEEREAKAAVVRATTELTRLAGIQPRAHAGFQVGYVGTVDFKKMHPEFVAMCSRVKVPDVRFVVCGDGEAQETLRRQAEAAGIGARFDLRGYVYDIRQVFEVLDVYGYPLCVNPGAELNLQEAMYAGVPPVVFARGGICDLVIDGTNGLVARDEKEYAEAIELLYHDPVERRRLGANARAFAHQHFGGEHSARDQAKVYEKMMLAPKRLRHWPAADLPDPDRGSALFIDSQPAAYGKPFAESLSAEDTAVLLEAEAQIASSSPAERWGINKSRTFYPEDPHLCLWMGLALHQNGEYRAAREEFEEASHRGLRHWRLHWYLARTAVALGETKLTRHHARAALRDAPDFAPLEALLGSLAEDAA